MFYLSENCVKYQTVFRGVRVCLFRASDPEEIYKIHERKQQLQRTQEREKQLDQLINVCKQELSLLSENQENWQYPLPPSLPLSLLPSLFNPPPYLPTLSLSSLSLPPSLYNSSH